MNFKDKIIEEFGDYIYQDKHGNYSVEKDDYSHRSCYVFLKNGYISSNGSNIVKERSFKQCYITLKNGIYQKVYSEKEKC